MGRTVDLVEARVGPADREVDRDVDRVDLDPVGRADPAALDLVDRLRDRDLTNPCNNSLNA